MSSPFQPDDNGRDERLRYAPRWARDQRSADDDAGAPPPPMDRPIDRLRGAVQGPAAAPRVPEAGQSLSRAVDFDEEPFEGDVAVKQLRLRQSLEPRPVPEPPLLERPGPRFGMFARFAVAAVIAAVIAFAVVALMPASSNQGQQVVATADSQQVLSQQGASTAQPGRPMPRLTVEDRRGIVNQPMGFGVDLKGAAAGSFVLVSGLAPGTRLTAGAPVGQGGWRMTARDLVDAQVVPPKNFAGTMELSVDLRLADDTVADSNVLRLEWVAPPTAVADAAPAPPPPSARFGLQSSPPVRELDRDEVNTLIKRGETFIANGDIAAARLLLRRAAEAGNARAALALGATYDPSVLKQLGVLGAAADIAQARAWYEKASELGSAEAPRRLEQLAQQVR
jgi:hypothetical protein